MPTSHVDREAYRSFYDSEPSAPRKPEAFRSFFERTQMRHFAQGGVTKGYVRGLAVYGLLAAAARLERPAANIHVLDTGCGAGNLSAYLGLRGFHVTGVDVSESATRVSAKLADDVGVSTQVDFLTESLEQLSLADSSVDFVIGHGALHHFIKYERVPSELLRVLKPGGEGFFADGFGENRAYHLFHDREQMARLGDVILDRDLIRNYFSDFEVELTAADWFSMLDKLYERAAPPSARPLLRAVSRAHQVADQAISKSGRGLRLAGSVMTHIKAPTVK